LRSLMPRHPRSTLFPYTTLFRSRRQDRALRHRGAVAGVRVRGQRLRLAEVPVVALPVDQVVGLALEALPPDVVVVGERDVGVDRSEEHTSELQSRENLVCRLLLE